MVELLEISRLVCVRVAVWNRPLCLSLLLAMLAACHSHIGREMDTVRAPVATSLGQAELGEPVVTLYGYQYAPDGTSARTALILSIRSSGLVIQQDRTEPARYEYFFCGQDSVADVLGQLVALGVLKAPRVYDAPADAGAVVLWAVSPSGSQYHVAEVRRWWQEWQEGMASHATSLRAAEARDWDAWMNVIKLFVDGARAGTVVRTDGENLGRTVGREFRGLSARHELSTVEP